MVDPFELAGLTLVDPGAGAQPPAPPTPPSGDPGAPPAPPTPAPDPLGVAGKIQFTPNEPTNPDTPPAPPAPETDFLKGIAGGKFQKADELSAYIAELEAKANKEPENPFVNDYVRTLNDAFKNGIDLDVFNEVATVDIEKLEPTEALVLQLMWQDKLSREDATLLVESKYRLGAGEDADAQDVKVARITAKTDANKAREFLKGHQDSALVPPAERLAQEQAAAWEPHYSKVSDSFKELSFKGKSGEYKFPVSPEVMGRAESLLKEVVTSGLFDVKPDADGMKFAQDIVYKAILADELPNILDAMHDRFKLAQATDQHNPKIPGGVTPPAISPQDGMAAWLAAQRGQKLMSA